MRPVRDFFVPAPDFCMSLIPVAIVTLLKHVLTETHGQKTAAIEKKISFEKLAREQFNDPGRVAQGDARDFFSPGKSPS